MAKYKYSSWMAALILGLGIVGYIPVKEAITEKPVDKKVILAIYKQNDYNSEAYENTYAQLHITVEKREGAESSIALDTIFNGHLLRDYPNAENAQLQEVTIPNVFAKREKVTVKYVLTYYSNGSQLQMQNSLVVNSKTGKLDIGI